MAKYLTEFNTYAEYTGATLSLPNVSLIKTTGKVYYKNVFAGASLGDILMWDNVNNKLVTTFGGKWDSTTYPIAQYEPIAINIYPASQAEDGKNRFMALKWASNSSATGHINNVELMWGPQSTTAGDITSTDQTALNGRANTNKAVAVMPSTSGNTQAEYPIFYAVNQFYTNGTSPGDWYVPSNGELSLFQSNLNYMSTKISAIKAASSSIVNTVIAAQWTSTENSTTNSRLINNMGNWGNSSRSTSNGVRGVIAI